MTSVWHRILVVLLAFWALYLLDWTYCNVLSTNPAYLEFLCVPPPTVYAVLAWLIAWLPALWIPLRAERPSQAAYVMLYVTWYLPTMVVPQYFVRLESAQVLRLQLALLGAFLLLGWFCRRPPLHLPRLRLAEPTFRNLLATSALGMYALLWTVLPFKLQLLGLHEIYLVRAEHAEALEELPIVRYFIFWLIDIVNPLMLLRGLESRNPLLAAAGVVGQLSIFSVTGHKGVIFSCLAITAIYLWTHRQGARFAVYVLASLLSIGVIALVGELYFEAETLMEMSVRRLLAGTGVLSACYFEFFSMNEKALYGQITQRLLGIPAVYDLPIPRVINIAYFGQDKGGANINSWMDGFANLGYSGIFLVTLAVGTMFWVMDSLSQGTHRRTMTVMLSFFAMNILASTSLSTCLVTHGFWLLVGMAYLWPKEKPAVGPAAQMVRPVSVRPPAHPLPLGGRP